MEFDAAALWRIANAVLAAAALAVISWAAVRKWRRWAPRMRLLFQAMAVLLATLIVSSVESMLRGIPVGLRTGMTTAACLWVLHAVLATEDRYTRP